MKILTVESLKDQSPLKVLCVLNLNNQSHKEKQSLYPIFSNAHTFDAAHTITISGNKSIAHAVTKVFAKRDVQKGQKSGFAIKLKTKDLSVLL